MNTAPLKKFSALVAPVIIGLLSTQAAPTMRLSADGGLTWTVVADNGPLDSDPTVGSINYEGPIGDWLVSISSALGEPALGSFTTPDMDLSTINISMGPASVIIQMSDTNFVAFPNQTFVATTTVSAGGTATYNSYRDTGNVLFGTTESYPSDPAGMSPSPTAATLIDEGPFTNGDYSASNNVVVLHGGSAPYSLTLETIIVHDGFTQSQSDATLSAQLPPPCNCALTFNSPASITNCAGDAIPDVTASEDCGSGPTPVPVTLAGTVTNGICPQIITRTNTATDDCGVVYTFVQTVTVNCLPDCTITTSVASTMAGMTGLMASVPDAGPGASYSWTVLNGSVTGGQGTPTLTWSAGTDTNSPVSIVVTVTAATGCQSTCGASVLVTPVPRPVSLGSGDTAKVAFWHNKRGQTLINSAPNSPALGNWLASNFPCLYGELAGKPNFVVAALFLPDPGEKGRRAHAEVLATALACYFTSSTLAGNGAAKYGFNISPAGTGAKSFNVGPLGTAIGLQNNTSYPVLQILQAANSKCPFSATKNGPVFKALDAIFEGINSAGNINQ